MTSPYKGASNPLTVDTKWISGAEVQVAPQETEISSYVVGGAETRRMPTETFSGI